MNGLVNHLGLPLPSVTLQLKNALNGDLVAFSSSREDGKYSFEADAEGNSMLYLIASYIGLKKDTLRINIVPGQTLLPLTHSFDLKEDARQLEEIFIKAEKALVTTSHDTTKYNVERFTTPGDRNIESVIRKMPGMKVNKDGTIYFNQQRITQVLLEGDNMTGENYKTITQNLKPQLVEEIQAIENYVSDDLLSGIISSDEVVLNLKIKNKKNLSGSIDAGYGTNNRKDISTNLISFFNGVKAFAFLNSNNTGKYQTDLLNLNKNNAARQSIKLIDHNIQNTNPFDNNQFRLNNSLSGSFSAINRINKDLKLTMATYVLRNKLYDYQSNSQLFYAPDTVRTENIDYRSSDNKNYQIEIGAEQRLTKKSRVSAFVSYTFKPETYRSDGFSSFNRDPEDTVSQNQLDKMKNFRGELKYVLKANAFMVLIATGQVGLEQANQQYNVNSVLYSAIPVFNGATRLTQLASSHTNNAILDIKGLKKSGYNYFYLNFGLNFLKSRINTGLFKNDLTDFSPIGNQFINNVYTNSNELYLAGKYTFDNKTIKFQAMLRGAFRYMKIYQHDSSFFYLQPELNLDFRISDAQKLTLGYKMVNSNGNKLDYYQNYILTDVRNINSGLNRLFYFRTHNVQMNYNNASFSDSYFSFQLAGRATYSPRGFLTTNYFDNMIYYAQRGEYKGIKTISGNLGLQKFIPLIFTDIMVNLDFSKTNYYAAVANKINQYAAISNSFELKAGTGFKLPVNFSAQFQYLKDITSLKKNEINKNFSFKYSLAARATINKYVTYIIAYDLYKLNGMNYNIMNSDLLFHSKGTKLTYSISGKNLFNVKSFINSYVSNTGESKLSTSLLSRYVMLNVSMPVGR